MVRSVAEHAAAIAELVASIPAGAPELLATDAERIAADPAAYTGRVCAADVAAPLPLPPFDNSQMDGYAVRAHEVASATPSEPVRLRVARRVHAGDDPSPALPGWAVPVMTGAPVPPGADAVVPVEHVRPPRFPDPVDADPSADDSPLVAFVEPVAAGAFVRPAGSDARRGDVLVPAGAALTAARIGVAAGAGVTAVPAQPRLRVLVVSTGHELRRPGAPLRPGQIDDANGPALAASLARLGIAVTARACRSDDVEAFLHAVADASGEYDLLLTAGGVSAGVREVVREALAPRGVAFTGVAMQPGGPQGAGLADVPGADGPRPAVCFPGNPVSALVSFEVFLRPALRARLGLPPAVPARAVAAESVDSPAAKHQVRRATLDDEGRIRFAGGPSSHLLAAYARSSVLVHVPVGVDRVRPGDELEIWRIDD